MDDYTYKPKGYKDHHKRPYHPYFTQNINPPSYTPSYQVYPTLSNNPNTINTDIFF